jgi:hypothetical protein
MWWRRAFLAGRSTPSISSSWYFKTDITFAILLTLAMRPIGAYLFGRAADAGAAGENRLMKLNA